MPDRIARPSENDRAPREVERARDATREHVVDLVRREVARDLAQNVHELPPALRLRARTRQLFFGEPQRVVRRAQNRAHAKLRLDARKQLANAKRLTHEVGRAETERLDRGFLGRERRDHEHRHVAPAIVVLDPLQELKAVHVREHDVEEQQIGRALLEERR